MASETPPDPLLETVLDGKYRIIANIGAGGMGKVYRAEQLALQRTVALKVLDASPNHRDADPAVERRFFLEASLSAKLAHPNVITVHDYGRCDTPYGPQFYLVMEILEGETLLGRMRRGPTPMPPLEVVSIAIEMARGLRAAHKAGLVHRDLKPGNVMLVPGEDGAPMVKILDFGLVKQMDEGLREDITQEGTYLGSPRYMAPEQVSAGTIDHRCDLYALGVILFQGLTGKPPFDGKSSMDVLVQHISAPVPWMRDVCPSVHVLPELEAIVRKLLEKSPSARFADADALLIALRGVTQLLRSDSTAAISGSGALARVALAQAVIAAVPTLTDQRPAMPLHNAESVSGSIAGTAIPVRASLAPAPSQRSKPWLVPAAISGLLVLGLSAALLVKSQSTATTPATAASTVGTATTTPSAAPQPPAATRGQLRLTSSPAGASVREDGVVLGVTPLTVAIDGQGPSRHYELVLAGHQTYAFDQAATSERVTMMAALIPEVQAPSSSPSHGSAPVRRVPRTPTTAPTTTTTTPTQGGSESIRLER
ncbi:MAG: serine/threonine-protein kinase [Deltaproteobacteria bacterium]|nr:serine/threonine-protein kinase [Deltaproteobacteria bacterium]